MDRVYEIRYSELFYKDLISILNYIKYELSNEAANTLFDKVINEISKRAINPTSFEKYKSNRMRKNTYYRIYVNNCTIFYIVKDNVMEVRRMLYSKRNFKKIM